MNKKIKIPIYGLLLHVYCEDDIQDAMDNCSKDYDIKTHDLTGYDGYSFNAARSSEVMFFIILESDDIHTIYHESFHTSLHMLELLGIKDFNEPLAYLMNFIAVEIEKALSKKD